MSLKKHQILGRVGSGVGRAALAALLLEGGTAIAQTPASTAIVPTLPAPPVSESAPPVVFLQAAAQALAAGRIGEAQEAMERAETRALDRSVRPSLARQPNEKPLVQKIAEARAALARGDRGEAIRLLQSAIKDPASSVSAM